MLGVWYLATAVALVTVIGTYTTSVDCQKIGRNFRCLSARPPGPTWSRQSCGSSRRLQIFALNGHPKLPAQKEPTILIKLARGERGRR